MRRWRGWLAGLLLVGLAGTLALWQWRQRQTHRFDPLIRETALRYGLDPALIKAVVWKESGFRPDAIGAAGEIGLMQLTEPAAQEWAAAERLGPLPPAHLFDPRTNLLAGAWYLRRSLRRHPQADDPRPFALAEYNAGRGNVLRWLQGPAATNSAAFIQAIGFPATRRYVRDILAATPRFA
ncbi:MAG: lytic transglycosylase domain-containing protein, partial [Verrucomicrobia bacterium]